VLLADSRTLVCVQSSCLSRHGYCHLGLFWFPFFFVHSSAAPSCFPPSVRLLPPLPLSSPSSSSPLPSLSSPLPPSPPPLLPLLLLLLPSSSSLSYSSPSSRVVASTPVKSSSALPDDFWNINGGEEETSKASGTEDDEFGLDEAMQRTREPRGVREGGDSNGAKKEKRQQKKTDQSVESMEGVESQEAMPQPIPIEIMRKISSCLDELRKCLEQAPHTTVSGIL